jgi:hypothetical protein
MGDNYGAMTDLSYLMNCLPQVNETSSKKRSFARYRPLFWLVRQSRAAVEPKLVTKYTHQLIYISFIIHGYVYGDVSIELRSLNFWFTPRSGDDYFFLFLVK